MMPFRKVFPFVALCFVALPVRAQDPDEIWTERLTKSWMDDHVALPTHGPATTFTRAQVWTSGIQRTDMQAFATSASDRTLGAKVRPFGDLDLSVGTAFTRDGTTARLVSSSVNWEAAWSQTYKPYGDLTLGVNTTGTMAGLEAGYAQSVTGSVGIPLSVSVGLWSTELRLSPNMNVNTASGTLGTRLTSEIVSRKVLSARNDAFTSVLDMKVGYGIAPDARPDATARLELRISPNL
ncbi:hypothetical protein [Microvirga pudoricolor]|uniref:hypothetical protein n=1 Tax=Microvirga pudoricolor TaxID=2778729 RepID=UPI001951D0B3|nr:hypothetical protein [Microvirga pudoricolor]MBM6594705.1 hypothetical protein [Microvirga pudoricolor]